MHQNLPEAIWPRPLSGEPVEIPPPALAPARIPLEGRHIVLEPMDARLHAAGLYAASHSCEQGLRIWDYLAYGPWPDLDSYTAAVKQQSADANQIFFALRCRETGDICG